MKTAKTGESQFERKWRAIDRDRQRERWTTANGLCFVCAKRPVKVLREGLTTMTCGSDECMAKYLLGKSD